MADRLTHLIRNLPWAKEPHPANWYTQLHPDMEMAFRKWVTDNKIPFDPEEPLPDYDMRGYYRAHITGDERAKQGFDKNDQKWHFPDIWKTPFHETFSADSQYANDQAPEWKGDDLVSPAGVLIFSDKPKGK